ncbi:hypothetical protein Tco_1142633 [Tanacetum coccineum]
MTDKYCPRNEMKKLEAELWNLKVIGTDVVKYNQRFQELALLQRPCRGQSKVATELMEQEVSTIAERQAENKMSKKYNFQKQQNQQQQQNKRQNTAGITPLDREIETIMEGI